MIILAFDSFKGSLTADEAVAAAREGVLAAMPDADVVCLPLADGGEGTADVLCRFLGAHWHTCTVPDSLMRSIEARYAIGGGTAVIEMASSAGLTLLQESERNPMRTTTYGVGTMMLDAIRHGCTRLMIGIGGSATCDGGMGMLSALGARFLDADGEELPPVGASLLRVANIDWSDLVDMSGVAIDVICDVTNSLFGPQGAAYIYAPQKGADADEVRLLDMGLRQLASVAGGDCSMPGSGAAGGLGYGLRLLGARLCRGIDVILDAAQINRHLHDATLVITGEGKADRQTLNGKLPYGVLQRAKTQNVPVILLAGAIEDRPILLHSGFTSVSSITPVGMPITEAMRRDIAMQNLKKTVEQHCRMISL